MPRIIKISFLFLCLDLLFLSCSSNSLPEPSLPSPCWLKTYGGEYIDRGLYISPEEDGYIIGGTYGFEPIDVDEWTLSSEQALILKTDTAGNIKWGKVYKTGIGSNVIGIEKLEDGYIVSGNYAEFEQKKYDVDYPFLMNISKSGKVKWMKGYQGGKLEDWVVHSLRRTKGGYVLTGIMTNWIRDELTDMWILKVKEDGEVAWQWIYGDEKKDDTAKYVFSSDDGRVFLVGEYKDTGLFLACFDENGNELWNKWYTFSSYYTSIHDVIYTGEKFIGVGTGRRWADGEDVFFFTKWNNDGEIEIVKGFKGNSQFFWGYTILETEDGYFLIGKRFEMKEMAPPEEFHFIVKLDRNINIKWSRAFIDIDEKWETYHATLNDGITIVGAVGNIWPDIPEDFSELSLLHLSIDKLPYFGKEVNLTEVPDFGKDIKVESVSGKRVSSLSKIDLSPEVIEPDIKVKTFYLCGGEEDKTPPETKITSYPKSLTESTSATFEFICNEASCTYECKLDLRKWEDCTSPKTYIDLLEGKHTFSVRAIDSAGNVDETPASYTWKISPIPPQAIIISYPENPTTSTTATFEFICDRPPCTFECQLDYGEREVCTSPKTYTGLGEGFHTFFVWAIDSRGIVSDTPASYSWTIISSLLWIYPKGTPSSPSYGDIDNDGKAEVVFVSDNIYALNGEDGSVLWSFSPAWPGPSSPALADINNDGKLEVVVVSFDKIYALNGEDGSELWVNPIQSGGLSSPAIGDLDNDGKFEVVFGSYNNNVYALNGEDGSLLWAYETQGSVFSSPAIGDIDNDGKLEVVIGSEDYNIYALNGENGSFLWSYKTGGGYLDSSPAIGDIDNDGKLEIVVGSHDGNLYAINGEDGTLLWSYVGGGGSPSLADLDNDGRLEVVVITGNYIYAINGEDGSRLWSSFSSYKSFYPPSIGDIDNDGRLEVVHGARPYLIVVLNGEDGSLSNYYSKAERDSSPLLLADINGDGKLDIVFGSFDNYGSKLFAISTNSPAPPPHLLPWPKFKHDIKNTGLYTGDPYPPW